MKRLTAEITQSMPATIRSTIFLPSLHYLKAKENYYLSPCFYGCETRFLTLRVFENGFQERYQSPNRTKQQNTGEHLKIRSLFISLFVFWEVGWVVIHTNDQNRNYFNNHKSDFYIIWVSILRSRYQCGGRTKCEMHRIS